MGGTGDRVELCVLLPPGDPAVQSGIVFRMSSPENRSSPSPRGWSGAEAKVVRKLQKCPSLLASLPGCELLLTWETKPQIKLTGSRRVAVTQHSCIFLLAFSCWAPTAEKRAPAVRRLSLSPWSCA